MIIRMKVYPIALNLMCKMLSVFDDTNIKVSLSCARIHILLFFLIYSAVI